ncbi:MAG: hypothetical protein ABSF45_30775 [Terriglobia bacterium]|jgi:hypothetical protein
MGIDPILKLGWVNSDQDLKLACGLAEKAQKNAGATQTEADTIAVFVEPILRGLGWDTLAWTEVSRDSRRRYSLADMWLLAEKGQKIAVMIEVRDIGLRKLREKDRRQLAVYARSLVETEEGEHNRKWRLDDGAGRVFLYAVLTNGEKWEVYDFGVQKAGTAAPSNSRNLLYECDLATDKEGLRKLSSFIGKDIIMRKVREFLP